MSNQGSLQPTVLILLREPFLDQSKTGMMAFFGTNLTLFCCDNILILAFEKLFIADRKRLGCGSGSWMRDIFFSDLGSQKIFLNAVEKINNYDAYDTDEKDTQQ